MDRDDANLRQFGARSKQTRTIASGPAKPVPEVRIRVIVSNETDASFGSAMDDIDATRFKYTGTSPQISHYESMVGSRHRGQAFMKDSFHA
jgi:hypothetical protein